MKNPNSASGAGAFRVTSSATLNSSGDATSAQFFATHFDRRLRWCPRSNSIQPYETHKGRITDV